MPKYTRSELIALLPGVNHAKISVAVSRGNLVESGGLIDDSNPTNKFWIDKRRQGSVSSAPAPPTTSRPSSAPSRSDDTQAPRATTLLEVKTKAQIAKLKEEIELLQTKKEKLFEEIIPVLHAEHLLVAQAEALKTNWHRASQALMKLFFAAHSVPKDEQARWNKELTNLVNEAVQGTHKDSKNNLRRIARDFAGKKGKGDRE